MFQLALDYLQETQSRVEARIADFLPKSHPTPEIERFYRLMLDYPTRPGKRLRPALCLLMCQAFGGKVKKAIDTAVALELLQSWLLIHDDIEDASILRRGVPCLHQEHGIPLAINVGDGLHCKMWEMLIRNQADLGYELTFQILSEFIQLSNRVVEGQHIELSWVDNNTWTLTEQDYWQMCVQKTAWYTCITPCRLGALIGGAEASELDTFIEIGMDLGVAFQIQDDVLNLIGEEHVYGKEIGGDIEEGKRTLILIHLFETCSEAEQGKLTQIMDKPRGAKTADEIQYVLELAELYGSIAYAQQRAKSLADKAHQVFQHRFTHLKDSAAREAKSVFSNLIRFIIDRKH